MNDWTPRLANGGRQFYHSCGEPVAVWVAYGRQIEIAPVVCPRCGEQLYRRDLCNGHLTVDPPEVDP